MKRLRFLVMAAACLILVTGAVASVPMRYEPPIAGFCYYDCSPCETSAHCPHNTPCLPGKYCRL